MMSDLMGNGHHARLEMALSIELLVLQPFKITDGLVWVSVTWALT